MNKYISGFTFILNMIKIGMTQLKPVYDKEMSLKNIEKYSKIASQNDADLVIFPEYYMSYANNKEELSKISEEIDGKYMQSLEKIAKSNDVNIITGINERDGDKIYDTSVYINSHSGFTTKYRKTHLYDAFGYKESDMYSYGRGPFDIFTVNDIKIGMMICYDIRFPEVVRNYSLQGADLVVTISGWFAGPIKEEQWLNLVSVRALENTVFFATSNLVGDKFTGITSLADPIGIIRNRCAENEDLIYSIIDKDRLMDVRKTMPLLDQRRPDLYKIR